MLSPFSDARKLPNAVMLLSSQLYGKCLLSANSQHIWNKLTCCLRAQNADDRSVPTLNLAVLYVVLFWDLAEMNVFEYSRNIVFFHHKKRTGNFLICLAAFRHAFIVV